jgi:tripartite motif-containing protein 56
MNKLVIFILLFCCCCCISLIGGGVFYFLSNKKDSSSPSNKDSTSPSNKDSTSPSNKDSTLLNNQESIQQTTTNIPMLYEFKSHTFTTAGKRGPTGPTLAEIKNAYSGVNWAQNSEFLNMKTQGIQEWKVPVTGNYKIRAVGAGVPYNNKHTNNGMNQFQKGIDATITTELKKGEIIKILVGQVPTFTSIEEPIDARMGGAGGTFVIRDTQTPIIISGGGGGRSGQYASEQSNGTVNNSGQNITDGGKGGSDGNGGGNGGNAHAGAGGGLLTNGVTSAFYDIKTYPQNTAEGGEAFIKGGKGGSVGNYSKGGFGGGGAVSTGGGGGGGGYSGGGGSGHEHSGKNLWSPGGGGGSFSITGKFENAVANNNDNGSVTITLIN